jgi:hypothetical protein
MGGAIQRTEGSEGGPHQTVIVCRRISSLSQLIKSTQRLSPTAALKPRRRWLRVRSRSRLRQGVRSMPAYRVFSFGHNGRFLSVQHMECADDQDAVQKARQGTDGYDAEVWGKGRCVVRMPSTPSPKYTTNELRAPIVPLSPAKRTALIECFNNNGLHKLRGCWCGTPQGKPISGVTVADLSRDGMFSVITNRQYGSAGLTERGQWFARTLIDAAGEIQARE